MSGSMKKKRRHTRSRHTHNRYLAQILCRWTGQTGASCQAIKHQQPVPAEWELRGYQSVARALELAKLGVPRDQVIQITWDEACREQDRVGVVMHSILCFCTDCVSQIVSNHAGQETAILA